MRTRLLALAALSVVVAGCGTGTVSAAGGQGTSAAASAATPAAATGSAAATPAATPAEPTASASAGSASAVAPAHGSSCAGSQAPSYPPGIDGLQFVSSAQGWAVSQDAILATADGGAHWTRQLSGKLNLTSVDFISGQDGWAAGTTSLLATTDGGAHWTALPEPCPVIRSVHFISPTTGFAVAGGTNVSGADPEIPVVGGVVLTTGDGGRTWQRMATPADAQTVCFSDPRHGWLGAAGLLYRTSDGGTHWTVLTSMAGALGSGYPAEMSVECANDGSAWALRAGPGAAMSQEPHVGFHADQSGATAIFAEQYFQTPGVTPAAEAPGSDAGPFSAIDSATAAFIDWCSACGYGTAPWDIAAGSGAKLAKEGNVGAITYPQAASFVSATSGWVAGRETVYPDSAKGVAKSQQRIVATTDGGRTWHVQYAGPWTSS
jgi:photosystem II stability/assembly factor-like uncharacterized protein